MKSILSWRTLAAAILLLVLSSAPVRAHRVIVFAWVEGGKVHVESSFPGGDPVVEGRVNVYDEQGNVVVEGKTDRQGRFSFAPPKIEDLRVEVVAGQGHMEDWTVRAGELPGVESARREAGDGKTEEHSHGVRAAARQGAPSGGVVSESSLERVEARLAAVEKELGGIKRELARANEKGPGMFDVLGGIGFLLGIFGAAALVKARNRR
ncbi:MAG: hypothetical protein ACLFOY_14040 [Desulfatibacillaceae bacterium]